MADCAEEVFVDLIDGRTDQATQIEPIFELRTPVERIADILTVGYYPLGTLLYEIWIVIGLDIDLILFRGPTLHKVVAVEIEFGLGFLLVFLRAYLIHFVGLF